MSCVAGNAEALHEHPELEGALFQVASQFNLLEMTSPRMVPRQGVAIYDFAIPSYKPPAR